MRVSKRSGLLAAPLMALTAWSLAGCGGSSGGDVSPRFSTGTIGTPTPGSTATPTPTATATPTPAPTATPTPAAGTGTITGRVTDSNGVAVSGVAVETTNGTQRITATTAADGTYTLSGIPNGQRVVVFSGAGRTTTASTAVAASNSVTVDVVLPAFTGTALTGLPVLNVDAATVNQENGTATLTGTVTNVDSNFAVLLVNGAASLITLSGTGSFTQTVILQPGANTLIVEATNANGTAQSAPQSVTYNSDFIFRATLTWDGSGDIDLHTFDAAGGHSSYAGRTITSGELDVDNTTANGPENFTCRNAQTPGRYKIAVNNYSGGNTRKAILNVTFRQNGQLVQQAFGPYTFGASNGNGEYPITTNTESWWRPADVIVAADGSVSLANADTTISLTRGVAAGRKQSTGK